MTNEEKFDKICNTSKWDVISCDEDGNWLPSNVEKKYEFDFFGLLHSCNSYEEFMMRSDLAIVKYDFSYFGFESYDEFSQWVKDYYNQK